MRSKEPLGKNESQKVQFEIGKITSNVGRLLYEL